MDKKFLITLAAMMVSVAASASAEKLTVDGPKGNLSAIIQKPELAPGQTCPMVILCHGFMGNKNGGVEVAMADRLEKAGIASIRFDFNGHGESAGEFVDMTVPNEIDDALAVYEYVRDLRYVSKIAICGHSQGGVVAAMTAGRLGSADIAAVVLFAPAAVLKDDAIRGNTMGARYNPLDPPESVELFGGRRLGREYIRTAFSLPIYETAALYDGPACILHGTGDVVVPYTYGERFHTVWPSSEYLQLDGEDHMFSKTLPSSADHAVEFLASNLKDKDMDNFKSLGAQGLMVPNPVLIIGTYDAEGNPDAMNAAWGGQSGYNTISICLSKHKTTENLQLKKEFTIAFADKANVVASDYVGLVSASKVPDKVARAGWTAVKADNVDAPVFLDFPLTLECKVVKFEDDGNGGILTGEIVNVLASEKILDADGKIDLDKMQAIVYDSTKHLYRVIGEAVAAAFSAGNALK